MMNPEGTTSWQVPQFEDSPESRLAWVEECLQEGEGWLEGQSAYKNLNKNIRIFQALFEDKTKSTLCSNELKYNIRKFVETLSEVREIGTYSSDARQFKTFAELLNKVSKCIYLESQFPRQLRKALQYAAVMSTGYIWPKCKADDYGYGERKLIFEPLGILDVVPVQVPNSNDVQEAYAATAFEYMPIAEAHGRFPLFQDQLKPVDLCSYTSRLQARRLDMAEMFRYGGQESRKWGSLYCEIRYTFIRDMRINRTNYELPMGDEGTSWYYKVPYVGQMILGGVRNGMPFMRPATPEDCLVYPVKRLIISAKGVDKPMYDGPAFDWHGQIPFVQYQVDDWPWEPMGFSLVQDVGSIEVTKRKIERQMDQVTTTSLNPPMGYDRTSTGGPKIENFDIFEQNVRVGMDGKPSDTLQSLLPESVRVTEVHFKFLEMLGQMEEKQLGINDIGNLEEMKMNMSSESFDKAVEVVGPIAKGIAATMEAGNAKIAYMLKFMIPQWMTTNRVMQYVGSDNLTPEILDYDPTSLVPSHLPDEYGQGEDPMYDKSQYNILQRARFFAKNLRLISVPSTLLKITQMQEQLKYLQLYRGGFPISPHTVAHKLGIENFGEIPGVTEFEKWTNWKQLELLIQAKTMAMAAQLGMMPPGGAQGAPGAGAQSGSSQAPPTGTQHAGGRPPSGQKPPHLVEKGKGSMNPRTTISES
jgi:hypothetical protein